MGCEIGTHFRHQYVGKHCKRYVRFKFSTLPDHASGGHQGLYFALRRGKRRVWFYAYSNRSHPPPVLKQINPFKGEVETGDPQA